MFLLLLQCVRKSVKMQLLITHPSDLIAAVSELKYLTETCPMEHMSSVGTVIRGILHLLLGVTVAMIPLIILLTQA